MYVGAQRLGIGIRAWRLGRDAESLGVRAQRLGLGPQGMDVGTQSLRLEAERQGMGIEALLLSHGEKQIFSRRYLGEGGQTEESPRRVAEPS